jgi:hypothetical protein
MTGNTVRHIICPECESAVRELSDSPCPYCRKCPFCGRRLGRKDRCCPCGLADRDDRVDRLRREWGVPERLVARKERGFRLRRRAERIELVGIGVVVGLFFATSEIVGALVDGDTRGGFWLDVIASVFVMGASLGVLSWVEHRMRRKAKAILSTEE